jgi:hypothetical protein
MKSPLDFLLGLALVVPSVAAQSVDESPPPDRLDRAAVEQLVGPIALYPDPLVALILPAATRPSDIVLAARFLERGGDPAATDAQTWEPSVKALAHYREVIAQLDENLAWTVKLGECFLIQPEDVMGSIQTLRRRARDAGLLVNTAEHEIVEEGGEIRIVPARATVIHVPRYDPDVLTVERVVHASHRARSYVSFSVGYGVGSWLCYDLDWRDPWIRIVHRPPHFYRQSGWHWRHAHRYEPHGGLRWSRWAPPPRPPSHAPAPRRDPDWSVPGRPGAPAPRDDDRDRRPRYGDRDREGDRDRDRRRDRPTREPWRPGEVAPLAGGIAPVVPDLNPVVPVTTTVDPLAAPTSPSSSARLNGEHRRRDRGERGGDFSPPRERGTERLRTRAARPDYSAASTVNAAATPALTPPPPRAAPARSHAVVSRREQTERPDRMDRADRADRADRPDRRERADRFTRAEDSPGRQHEPR